MNKKNPDYIKNFKNQSIEKRLADSDYVKEKYNNKRVPIIIDTFEPQLNIIQHKYLVPKDLVLSNFFCVLRKNNTIKSTQTIFLLCNNKLLNMSSTIEDIYKLEKEKDNFLYFILTIENTFGF